MRALSSIAAAAAVLSLAACETDTAHRQGRSPARYDTAPQPAGEARPNDGSPMRGDELYPGFSGSTGTGSSTASGESPSGSQTGSSDLERNMGTERSGRRSGSDSTVRPKAGTPPSSDPLGNTTPDYGSSATPFDEGGFENPFALGAAKSPKDGGVTGGSDGGTRFENRPGTERY